MPRTEALREIERLVSMTLSLREDIDSELGAMRAAVEEAEAAIELISAITVEIRQDAEKLADERKSGVRLVEMLKDSLCILNGTEQAIREQSGLMAETSCALPEIVVNAPRHTALESVPQQALGEYMKHTWTDHLQKTLKRAVSAKPPLFEYWQQESRDFRLAFDAFSDMPPEKKEAARLPEPQAARDTAAGEKIKQHND